MMDVETLARLQFAFTIAFHYIYPPLSIGLGVILVILEGFWLKTKDVFYKRAAQFWVKIFALTFAMGVATGIVMEFEFGTNWATYSRYVGDIFGSALAAEGIFAFFLESGFLAVLLFGWDRVSPRWHFFSALMVCLGAHFSAVWIVVANSWQQTPAGYEIVAYEGGYRAQVTDFWEMVFNPSTLDRLSHTLFGCWQAGAFLVVSVSAFYLLKRKHVDFAKTSMRIGLAVALVAAVLQVVTGHSSAVGVARNQPAKLAAFEGRFTTRTNAPLSLVGWVDEKNENFLFNFEIPGLLSWLVYGNTSGKIIGLEEFPVEDRPPVNASFQFFHLMVTIGFLLLALAAGASVLCWRGRLFQHRWLLWLLVFSVLGPQIANQAGWFAAEVGRQPWIVYGLLRTSDGLSKVVTSNQVLASLILFALIYLMLFILFVFLLHQKIKHGPEIEQPDPDVYAPKSIPFV